MNAILLKRLLKIKYMQYYGMAYPAYFSSQDLAVLFSSLFPVERSYICNNSITSVMAEESGICLSDIAGFDSMFIPYFTNIWHSVAHMSYISRSLALPNGIYLNELQVCSAVQTLQTSFVLPRNFAPLNMPQSRPDPPKM